jgi:hypothetical protein
MSTLGRYMGSSIQSLFISVPVIQCPKRYRYTYSQRTSRLLALAQIQRIWHRWNRLDKTGNVSVDGLITPHVLGDLGHSGRITGR